MVVINRTLCTSASRGKNYSLRQPHCRLTPRPRGTPANIRIDLIFLETRIIDLHFATDGICLPSFKFFWRLGKTIFSA